MSKTINYTLNSIEKILLIHDYYKT